MSSRILVISAKGMLGRPVVDQLTESGRTVRILTRSVEKAHRVFGGTGVEIAEGSVSGCLNGAATWTSLPFTPFRFLGPGLRDLRPWKPDRFSHRLVSCLSLLVLSSALLATLCSNAAG